MLTPLDYECDHIMELGKGVIRRSKVGSDESAFTSNTRTSSNGWLKRDSTEVVFLSDTHLLSHLLTLALALTLTDSHLLFLSYNYL